jgi:hypothetical protein
MYSLQGQKSIDREISFWAKVDKRQPYECWPWLASTNKDGYGQFWVGNTFVGAHRYSWELTRKCEVPDGKMILHLCDNRICCNPNHLYCGDAKQNAKDRVERGPKIPAHILANPKLMAGEIWLIRRLRIPIKSNYKRGRYKFPQSYVAKMFKVDQSLISLIWKSDKWLSREGTYV